MQDSKVKVVLIDDEQVDNVAHSRCIESTSAGEIVKIFSLATDALDWFKESPRGIDLILLDLNMPLMDGFEFIDHHHQMAPAFQAKKILVMLGASLSAKGYERLSDLNVGWHAKPMTKAFFLSLAN